MPRLTTLSGAWIFQRLELEAGGRQPYGTSVRQQSLSVGGDEMRHGAPVPDVAVQPEPTVHRVNHPIATPDELPIGELVRHEHV
jgi:hypothetical protein